MIIFEDNEEGKVGILYRHDVTVHGGEPQKYFATMVAPEKKIVRLHCNKALNIEKQDPFFSTNDRMEGGRGGLVRISATRVTY